MDTNVLTPMRVFNLPQHLIIPLFQRPYVWDEEEQWQPLWQDIRRLADLHLDVPGSTAQHFLGAIVVQAQDNPMGEVDARNVIDGQQRLTTLQLLMDAAAAVFTASGLETLASQLHALTHNSPDFIQEEDERLKIRHTNKDRAAYDEVMNAEPPVGYGDLRHASSRIAGAHRFFAGEIEEWLGDRDEPTYEDRAKTIATVLKSGLQIVVIDLLASENSQEIFETLNARGTPLTAADLIRNFVFQRLEKEGADTRKVYQEVWPFESKFWETEISVGRTTVTRGSLFLNQWLGSRVGEEVSPKATFTRFKHYVDHECGQKMADLLGLIRVQADAYESWIRAADDPHRELKPVEMAVYRMHSGGVELLKPLLIWLYDPDRQLPQQVIDRVIGLAESWMTRRQLLRLTSADLGRVVADLMRLYRDTDAQALPGMVEDHLRSLRVASTYWPGDDEIRQALRTESAYRRLRRGRLRMLLEAVEDRLRSRYDQPPVPRRGYPIEHLLPQKWEANWPVESLEEEIERAARVHRLGNLTLLTESLNASVSNGPWVGANGKRAKLEKYDVLLMNREIRSLGESGWDESKIDVRTEAIIDALLETWPVPAGHVGEVTDKTASDTMWIEIKHLVAAGLLEPGARLVPRPGDWDDRIGVVTENGAIEVDGKSFFSPSAAGRHVKGAVANGWYFWRLEDGRKLADVRSLYRGQPEEQDSDDLDGWDAEDDIDDAVAVWNGLSAPAKGFFRLLIEASPEPMAAPVIAERLELEAGSSSVASVLTWPSRIANRVGHHLPVRFIDGDVGQYWMDESTAEVFSDAIKQVEADE